MSYLCVRAAKWRSAERFLAGQCYGGAEEVRGVVGRRPLGGAKIFNIALEYTTMYTILYHGLYPENAGLSTLSFKSAKLCTKLHSESHHNVQQIFAPSAQSPTKRHEGKILEYSQWSPTRMPFLASSVSRHSRGPHKTDSRIRYCWYSSREHCSQTFPVCRRHTASSKRILRYPESMATPGPTQTCPRNAH